MTQLRFRDARRRYDFLDDILVHCPRCGSTAAVRRAPEASERAPRRLTCGRCGLARTQRGRSAVFTLSTARPAYDPYFLLPLRLQLRTRHGWLWAYNREHLTMLERYIAADLRENAGEPGDPRSMASRLPRWVKLARNRDENLRAVARIREEALRAA